MALEKSVAVDRIEVMQNGIVQYGTTTRILEDGKEISRSNHRSTVNPGDDYSQLDQRVQAMCAVIHTAEVVAAYEAANAPSDPAPTPGDDPAA